MDVVILVATNAGCRAFTNGKESEIELAGHQVSALTPEAGDTCLAVLDQREVWRRSITGAWSRIAVTDISLQSITSVEGTIFAGGMDDAVMLRISANGKVERLEGFDKVPGRSEWFAGGPPLGVRSLTATLDGAALLAAVHVGGIPRSSDGGETWTPTIPVMFDVHEVCAHPQLPNLVAAAAAAGLCVSNDGGLNWAVFSEGLEATSCLAVAVLQDEVLFSVQDGPFAKRSQVWKWRIGGKRVEQVRDGLPEWLVGKIDTGLLAAGDGRAAIVDGGGNLWLSKAGSAGWERMISDLPYAFGLAILP
jgi:hypothetical protein